MKKLSTTTLSGGKSSLAALSCRDFYSPGQLANRYKALLHRLAAICVLVCLLLSGCGQNGQLAFSLKDSYSPETLSFQNASWNSHLPDVYQAFEIQKTQPVIYQTNNMAAVMVPVTLVDLKASGQMTLCFTEDQNALLFRGVLFELHFTDETAENAFWEEYEALVAQWAEANEVFQGYLDGAGNYTSSSPNEDGLLLGVGHTGWEEGNEDLAFAYSGKRIVRLQFFAEEKRQAVSQR